MSIPEVDSRARLIEFLKGHFALKGSAGGGAPTDAQYITLATDATLSRERVLRAGANVGLTDGGDGGALTIVASGGVDVSGTPSNNQIATFTDSDTIQGESNLTFDGSTLTVTGDASVTSTLTVGDGNLADGDALLILNSDRAWTFKQSGNGSSANLMLQNTTGSNKDFIIKTNGETRFVDNDGVERAALNNDTGDLQIDGDLTVSSGVISGSSTAGIAIDSSGHVTHPNNPSFSVGDNDNQTIPQADWTTIQFDTENYDVGSNFASNTFTAPETGKYTLSTQIRLDSVDHSTNQFVWIRIVTSNRSYFNINSVDNDGGSDFYTPMLSVVADMDANDTAYVQLYINVGSANTQGASNSNYTAFQGILIG